MWYMEPLGLGESPVPALSSATAKFSLRLTLRRV